MEALTAENLLNPERLLFPGTEPLCARTGAPPRACGGPCALGGTVPSSCGASPWEFVKASVGVYMRASLCAHVYVYGVREPCLCTCVCEGAFLRVSACAFVHACPFAHGCACTSVYPRHTWTALRVCVHKRVCLTIHGYRFDCGWGESSGTYMYMSIYS